MCIHSSLVYSGQLLSVYLLNIMLAQLFTMCRISTITVYEDLFLQLPFTTEKKRKKMQCPYNFQKKIRRWVCTKLDPARVWCQFVVFMVKFKLWCHYGESNCIETVKMKLQNILATETAWCTHIIWLGIIE